MLLARLVPVTARPAEGDALLLAPRLDERDLSGVPVRVAVLASLLAIWKFAGTDILWRTVATCAVIGSGTVAFYWVNVLFGKIGE